MAFPVSGDVCTRFATQIILSRCPPNKASAIISIIPGPTSASSDKAKKHLEKFKRTIDPNEFEYDALGQILNDASAHLGLPEAGVKLDSGEPPSKRFSDDVVRIELSGPDQNQLSVVDVPGLFHNPTKLQTAEDKDIIRNLIEEYIGDKRTIIMAVCDATSNLANQEVFQLARNADPEGQRTVGIVTKCDAVQAGDETTTLDIALNKYETLKHGWFVVKNRSTKDISDNITVQQRHDRERAFFDTTKPWNTIPHDRRGVSPLKVYLGKLLSDHIRSEFPGLVRELQTLHEQSLKHLDQLGSSRQTSAEQRRYLGDVAATYEKYVEDVLDGKYDMRTRQIPTLKLRKRIRDFEDEFADSMRERGHTYTFKTTEDEYDPEFDRADYNETDIYGWIRGLYLDNRGVELPGMVNPSVLQMAFQDQSVAWEEIAVDFFGQILSVVNDFNKDLLEHVISDRDVRRNVQVHLELHCEGGYKQARQRLMQCLADERENILKTVNDYYTETLQKCRRDRIIARLKGIGFTENENKNSFGVSIDMQEILEATNLKNEDEAVNSIHDALKAYYKVSMKRFADNILTAPIESELLGKAGPVRAFNTRFVNDLSDEQLSSLAAETSLTSAARADAKARAERLEQALTMAKTMGA